MQKILFGKKKKHVIVPDGFVLLNNHDNPEVHEAILGGQTAWDKELYHRDMYLSLMDGVFHGISSDDFVDFDGKPIDNTIDNYAVIVRDVRALDYHPAPVLPDDATIVFDPEIDDGWHMI